MSGPSGPVFEDHFTLSLGDNVDIRAIRAKIVDIIHAAYPELKAYARAEPAQRIVAPVAMAYPIDRIAYGDTFDGAATIYMPIRIYLSQDGGAVDQDALDEYITPRGPKSVPKLFTIAPNVTLGGLVDDARIIEARNYGIWPIANVPFLGVEFAFEIKV